MHILDLHRTLKSAIPLEPNLFIGVSNNGIDSKDKLAQMLSISVLNILKFNFSQNEVSAYISSTYNFTQDPGAVIGTGLRYLYDLSGLCANPSNDVYIYQSNLEFIRNSFTRLGNNTFRDSGVLQTALESLTNVAGAGNWQDANRIRLIYIPNVTNPIGGDASFFGNFRNINPDCTIVANTALQTNNGGDEDADIAYARNRGCTIVYGADVIYITPPSQIIDLTYDGNVNFTEPSFTNTFREYRLYINNLFSQLISPGDSIPIPSGSKIKVLACDTYYNRSESNEITISGL